MNKPHKHAELIKAWADGAIIQVAHWKHTGGDEGWHDCNFYIDWNTDDQFRIKPEPKPDVVRYTTISQYAMGIWTEKNPHDNLKLTFDGETGELKSAEVLK